MRKRPTAGLRTVLVTISFRKLSDREETIGYVDRLMELFDDDPVLASVPMHWHLPSRVLDQPYPPDSRDVLARFRMRLAAGSDLVLPAGYSGLPHGALLPSDVELDLFWAINDPETGARRHVLDSELPVVYPPSVDLQRGSIVETYADFPYPLLLAGNGFGELIVRSRPVVQARIGIGAEAEAETGDHDSSREAATAADPGWESVPISVVRNDELPRRRPERIGHYAPVPQTLLLTIPCDEAETEAADGRLGRKVSRLIERGGYRAVSASRLIALSRGDTAEIRMGTRRPDRTSRDLSPAEYLSLSYCVYSSSELTEAARRARTGVHESALSSSAASSGFLERAAGRRRPSRSVAEHEAGPRKRILVADMSGDTVMAGDRVSAEFESGRLVELSRGARVIRLARPSSSSITIAGERRELTLESAFSFDDEDTRGLQERFRCETNLFESPVVLDVDVFFVDTSPQLFVYLGLSVPEVRTEGAGAQMDARMDALMIDEIHPFDLTVEVPETNVEIAGRYPDGEVSSRTADRLPEQGALWGTSFAVETKTDTLLLFVPELSHTRIARLPIILERQKRGTRLTLCVAANTAGGPAQLFSNHRFAALFGIDLLEPSDRRMPVIPPQTRSRLHRIYAIHDTPVG